MAGPFVIGRHGAVIGAPPRQVFDYLADMARHREWSGEENFQVTARPEGPPRVGSVYRRERTGQMLAPLAVRGGMGDSQVTVVKTMTITDHEPYLALAFETRNSYNGLLHSVERMSFELRQETEGTHVTMVTEVEAMVPSAFIGPVYAMRVFRAVFERLFGGLFANMVAGPHLPRIKELLETGDLAGEI